jgi:hypothetical protein
VGLSVERAEKGVGALMKRTQIFMAKMGYSGGEEMNEKATVKPIET